MSLRIDCLGIEPAACTIEVHSMAPLLAEALWRLQDDAALDELLVAGTPSSRPATGAAPASAGSTP